jgi:hypothetical protein
MSARGTRQGLETTFATVARFAAAAASPQAGSDADARALRATL